MEAAQNPTSITLIIHFFDELPSPMSVKFDDLPEIVVSRSNPIAEQNVELEIGKEIRLRIYSAPAEHSITETPIRRADESTVVFESGGTYDITFERKPAPDAKATSIQTIITKIDG